MDVVFKSADAQGCIIAHIHHKKDSFDLNSRQELNIFLSFCSEAYNRNKTERNYRNFNIMKVFFSSLAILAAFLSVNNAVAVEPLSTLELVEHCSH